MKIQIGNEQRDATPEEEIELLAIEDAAHLLNARSEMIEADNFNGVWMPRSFELFLAVELKKNPNLLKEMDAEANPQETRIEDAYNNKLAKRATLKAAGG